MQRKSIIVPIIALLVVGGVWASSSLFPSPTGFPATPATPGTIGYILGLFGIDGTAPDSAALAGRSATGYLQGNNCLGAGEVWRGVDTNGQVVCGLRSTPLAIGHFCTQLSPEVRVLKGGNAPGVIPNMTDTLQSGDIIQTNGGTATVCFQADNSLLRLDTGTVVALETGNLGGNTVAQAILSDGRLWGRVLTSTGINIGGGGLIAGVRGTSVSVEKEGVLYHLSIPHSTSTTAAAMVTCGGGSPRTMIPGSILNSGGCDTLTQFSLLQLYTDTWIAENTRKDLVYLDSINTNSHIAAEILATDPIAIEDKRGTCGSILNEPNTGSGIWDTASNSCITGFADYSSSEDTAFHMGNTNIAMTNGAITVRDDNHFCPQYATQLWAQPFKGVDYSSNLNGGPVTVAGPYSDSDRTFLAAAFPNIATLLGQPKELIVNSLGCNQGNTSGWDESIYPNGYYYYDTVNHGIYVTGSGYISYPISALGNLAGKTITIELDSPITDSNAVLLLLDSLPTGTANPAFYINSAGEPICITQTTSGCSANKVGSKYTLYLGNIVATRFQFGNGLARNKPINRTIKKITIQ